MMWVNQVLTGRRFFGDWVNIQTKLCCPHREWISEICMGPPELDHESSVCGYNCSYLVPTAA